MLLTAQHLVGAHDVSSVPPRRSRGPAGPAASPRVPRAGGLGVGHTEGDQHVVSAATAERGGERPRAWRRRRRWLELPAGEHRQVVVAVSASRCSTWSRAGSLVHRSLVTGGEGGLDHGAAHEAGAANEEDAHGEAGRPSTFTTPGLRAGLPAAHGAERPHAPGDQDRRGHAQAELGDQRQHDADEAADDPGELEQGLGPREGAGPAALGDLPLDQRVERQLAQGLGEPGRSAPAAPRSGSP